jgi:uncharacterized membrane protein
MTREDFIARLRRGLAGMSPEAADDIVADYEAHFSEGKAAGRTEDQVAEALGDPDRLARELRAAAKGEPWEDRRGDRGGGRRFARRLRVMGLPGWLGLTVAVIVVILVLPLVLAIVGTIVGVVLVFAFVVTVVAVLGALVFGGLGFGRGRWGRFGVQMGGPIESTGPSVSRSFSWSGGDALRVSLPAEVAFTQSQTVALSITGPSGALDHVIVEHGEISYDRWVRHAGRLRIVLSAPDVTRFSVRGSADVNIADYRQDLLKIRIAGRGAVRAAGEARVVNVGVAGKGDVDLGAIKGESVKVEIAGSGKAIIAPTEIAEVGIAGSGVVTLLTNPPTLRTRMAGSGRIVHAASSAA